MDIKEIIQYINIIIYYKEKKVSKKTIKNTK